MKGKSKYFITGAVFGVVAALAFAPKKGSETRKTVSEGVKKLKDSSDEIIKGIKEKILLYGEYEKIVYPDEEIIISKEYEVEVDENER